MKFGCSFGIFLNSAHLICRSTDISKCFSGSLRLRDNESQLYLLIMVPVNYILTAFVSMRITCYSKAVIKDDVTNLVIGTVKYKIIESKEISFSAELLIWQLTVTNFHRLKKTVGFIRQWIKSTLKRNKNAPVVFHWKIHGLLFKVLDRDNEHSCF